MNITMIASLSMATAATALRLAGTAHADNNYQQFASPSGAIRCILDGQDGAAPIAMCQIVDHTYVVPPGLTRDDVSGGPCPDGSGSGRDFRLDPGQPGFLRCTYSAPVQAWVPGRRSTTARRDRSARSRATASPRA